MTIGHVQAELLIKFAGAEEPVTLGHISVPLALTGSQGSYKVSVDTRQVKELVEQVYRQETEA